MVPSIALSDKASNQDMQVAVTAVEVLLFLGAVAANAFYLLSIFAGYRFFSRRRASAPAVVGPPATIMIPLRGLDYGARRNYAGFCEQDYPQYQIVFGVQDAGDSAVPVVRKLMEDFPGRDIELVVCPDSHGQNAKVSNLQNMFGRVKHDLVVIVDSDIRVGPGYLKSVLAPLSEPGVGLVTCLYRAAEAPDFGARLEALGFTGEFVPGVLMARMIEGVRFALGSTMATTRARLEEIGGFTGLADYLADDFMLGKLIADRGYEVRVSDELVETAMQPVGITGMIRHQMRWARSTRISRPLGYLGLILTYGTALAVLCLIVDRASFLSIGLLAATVLVRLSMAWMIGVYWMRDRIMAGSLWLVPFRDLLSFGIWVTSWVGRTVEWRGRSFEVARDGKIVPAE